MVADHSRFFIQHQQASFIHKSGKYGMVVHINTPDIVIHHLTVVLGKVGDRKKRIVQVLLIYPVGRSNPDATFPVFKYGCAGFMCKIFFSITVELTGPEIKMHQIEPAIPAGNAKEAVVDEAQFAGPSQIGTHRKWHRTGTGNRRINTCHIQRIPVGI